jgi:deoxyinosine 3'endonuclease (endonuclease V)
VTRAANLAAFAGLGAAAAAVGVAGLLLHRTLAVAEEIGRYTDAIAEAAVALRDNTEVAPLFGDLCAGAARVRAAAGASSAEGAVR